MEKTIFSEKQTQLVQCINQRKHIYQVLWDEQPVATDDDEREGENEQQYSYQQAVFSFPPPMALIKKTVTDGVNERIHESIVSGFEWNGHKVWLSETNQQNYQRDFTNAILTDGETLPVTYKFGTDEEPDYHTFNDTDELKDFWTKASKFINNSIQTGRIEKDSIDWSKYQY